MANAYFSRGPIFCSIWMPFFASAVSRLTIVLRGVAAELVVWIRDVHCEIRADHAFDGFFDLPLQGFGEAADEDVEPNLGVVEAIESQRHS